MISENIVKLEQDDHLVYLKGALDFALREYAKKNLDLEISITEGGRVAPTGEERRIKEWSLESSNQRRFLMYVIRSTLEDCNITTAEIVKKLRTSRPTVIKMMNFCLERKWIENEKCSKGHNHLTATPIMIECYQNYVNWLWNVVDDLQIRDLSTQIKELKKQINSSNE
tara:strand:- start:15979 stop:16485 length:507 start_codon:yes stop_codon:yes gene_type:complete